jgi:outer membrane protein
MELRSCVGTLAAVTCLLSPAASAEAAKKWRVAVLSDHPAAAATASAQVAAIRDVVAGDSSIDVDAPPALMKSGDGSVASIRRALDELLADANVDLVVALGPIGSHVAVRRATLAKPVIAARVLDPALDGAPQSGSGSGSKNLVYVADSGALDRDLAAIRALGGVSQIAILVSPSVLESVENVAEGLRARAKSAGLEATVAPATPGFSGSADLAYLYAADEGPAAAELIAALHARKIRTFSARGAVDVSAGVLAGLTSLDDAKQRARRVAILVSRIASGEAAAGISTAYQRAESSYLNLGAARAVDWTPSFLTLTDAEVIGAAVMDADARPLSLIQAVTEALADNQDFAANRLEIEAASEDLSLAIANFLPKTEVQLRGLMIDGDRAAASLGTQPQSTLSGLLRASGVLYSDKAFANHTIQGELDGARQGQRDSIALDLTLETARAYLAVQQTRVLERVRLENVRKTRANLAQARVRKSAGSASPTEVLRWESQIAIDRREVLRARSLRRLAETQLNRLCHRPLDERVAPADEEKDQGMALLGADQMSKVIQNESQFASLVSFMVREGLEQAPELRALSHATAASERAVSAAWRAFFVPTVAYQAELTYRFAKGGAGQEPPTLPPMLPPDQAALLGGLIPPPVGDLTYQLAAVLSLPLPLDTVMFSDLRRAESERARRQAELTSSREKLEQRIRSAAFQVGASHPSVALAEASAESARKGLAIVQDAYASGAIGVLDVLDAQNVALVAELLAVNAKYEFMSDELHLERSLGTFLFLKSKEERDAWMRRSIESISLR